MIRGRRLLILLLVLKPGVEVNVWGIEILMTRLCMLAVHTVSQVMFFDSKDAV